MKYFFDSSAIVKRYITEIGSAWVKTVVRNQPKQNLYLSFVTGAEATGCPYSFKQGKSLCLCEDYPDPRDSLSGLKSATFHRNLICG